MGTKERTCTYPNFFVFILTFSCKNQKPRKEKSDIWKRKNLKLKSNFTSKIKLIIMFELIIPFLSWQSFAFFNSTAQFFRNSMTLFLSIFKSIYFFGKFFFNSKISKLSDSCEEMTKIFRTFYLIARAKNS